MRRSPQRSHRKQYYEKICFKNPLIGMFYYSSEEWFQIARYFYYEKIQIVTPTT